MAESIASNKSTNVSLAHPGDGETNQTGSAAGRGGIAVAIAKGYFLVIGLLQQVLLTRVLGTASYGGLSTALSISAVIYNPIVTTSIQGVSRTVARSGEAQRAFAVRRVLTIHAAIALPLALLFIGCAGPLVAWIHAPHLALPVRVLGAVLFFYSLYAPLIGVMNGSRRFVWQAGFDMAYATLRTLLMVGGAYWFTHTGSSGVEGASAGFALAAGLVFIAASALIGTGQSGHAGPTLRSYLAFIAPVFAGQILLNLLQQADLTLLRYFAASAAIEARLPADAADSLVGAYRATQLFCFLPYQLLLSITFVLFPLLARAHKDERMQDVRLYVMTGVRLALVIAGVMVAIISGLAGPLLRLVFPTDIALHATDAMQLLALGFGAFALFGILTTVLTSLKAERASAATTAVAFALVAILGAGLLKNQGFGAHLLMRTAVATSVGLLLATLIAAVLVRRRAGGVVAFPTLLRTLMAAAATVGLGRCWSPEGKVMTIAAAAALAAANITILIATRELTKRDWQQILGLFRRHQRNAPMPPR
ncbi:MAG TPA: lipopolysaccharide biosynthesis protein [Polyangiaceae bacterium]